MPPRVFLLRHGLDSRNSVIKPFSAAGTSTTQRIILGHAWTDYLVFKDQVPQDGLSPEVGDLPEAQHNVGPPPPPDHDLLDPELTSRGITQCTSIPNTYPNFFQSLSPSDTLIVVSPLRRTIQTYLLGFSAFLPTTTTSQKESIPHMLLPELQECGNWPCDTGDELERTKERFKTADFLDWSTVESKPDWNKNRGMFEATEPKNVARAKWVRQWLKSRPERVVVLVTHHGLLRRLTKAPNAHNRQLTPTHLQWSNAELREYRFKEEDDEEADLVRVEGSIL